MSLVSRELPIHPCRRVPLLVALLVIGLFSTQQGSGATLVSATEVEASHGHNCACGTKCRGNSCCCGPKRPKAPKHASNPVKDQAANGLESGPCMGAAPCGDAGLPTSPTTTSLISKMAAIGFVETMTDAATSRFLPVSSPCILPPSHVSRLDEPPEDVTFS